MEIQLQEWSENTLKKYSNYKDLIFKNPKFGGFKVWYSPIKINPTVMIIGINPGNGEFTQDKKININESDKFEYLPHNPKYTLANEVKKIFKDAGLYSILENETVKTNYYHIITQKSGEIKECFNKVDKSLYENYESDAKLITKEIIQIIKPKYIFCEGILAYRKVINLFENKVEFNWEKDVGFTEFKNPDVIILGFSRRFSKIRNKGEATRLLKEKINNVSSI